MVQRLVARGFGSALLSLILAAACADTGTGPDGRTPDPVGTPTNPLERFVTVAPGVSLQYLDFGGTGEPVLLLAGLGHTANVFRTLAPLLTDDFRVRALTRRGYGASSKPVSGYDRLTLARDILALLDTLGVVRMHLVGHSIASEEMTRFAAAHPTRVGRLVYLDAAFDRTVPFPFPLDSPPAWSVPPDPTISDVESRIAFGAWMARGYGVALPAGEVSTMTIVNSAGVVVAWSASPTAGASMLSARESPPYASVLARALAIYASPASGSDMAPWLTPGTSSWTAADSYVTTWWLPYLAVQSQKFDTEVVNSTVSFIGTRHFMFLTHLPETAAAVRTFLRSP